MLWQRRACNLSSRRVNCLCIIRLALRQQRDNQVEGVARGPYYHAIHGLSPGSRQWRLDTIGNVSAYEYGLPSCSRGRDYDVDDVNAPFTNSGRGRLPALPGFSAKSSMACTSIPHNASGFARRIVGESKRGSLRDLAPPKGRGTIALKRLFPRKPESSSQFDDPLLAVRPLK